jgi:thiamine monophosphate kinase
LNALPLSLDRIGESIHSGGRYFYELAAGGGEDYELVFTTPGDVDEAKFQSRAGVKITKVGKIVAGGNVIRFEGEKIDPRELHTG